MDKAAREVLKKHKSEIKDNLNLDDAILDALEANGTLESDHIDQIKTERTNSEKISTLLSILQKRGPGAFQALTDAIGPTYRYLADKLLLWYQEENRKLDQDSGNNSAELLKPTERPSSASSNANMEVPSPVSNNQSIFPNVASNVDHTANRIPETDVTQGHFQQDRHSFRRPSHHSLDMINPINQFHPNNSRRTSSFIDFATHKSLNRMYTKLKMHLFHINEREQSFNSSPVPVNFEMVEGLLDQLLKLEQDCYKAIGGSSKESLHTSIVNLKILKADLQKNLNKKEEQITKYGDKILKLETKCKNDDTTIKMLRLENTRLNEENKKLREEVSRNKHTEEEANVKMSFKQLTKHFEELKKKDGKKKDTNNMKVSELTNPAVSLSSTLQARRGIHAGINSKNAGQNLREMRTKCDEISGQQDELQTNRQHYSRPSNKYESMTKQVTNKENVTPYTLLKQTLKRQIIGQQNELQTNRQHYSRPSNKYESMTKQVTNKESVTPYTLLKHKPMRQIIGQQDELQTIRQHYYRPINAHESMTKQVTKKQSEKKAMTQMKKLETVKGLMNSPWWIKSTW